MARRKTKGTKASSGDGSTRLREEPGRPPRWECRGYLPKLDGTMKRVSYFAETEAAAKDKFREARDRAKRGEPVTVGARQKLEDYLSTWVKGIRVSPQTRIEYEQVIEDYLVPVLGGLELPKITRQHVKAAIAKWEDTSVGKGEYRRKLSGSRVLKAFTVLSSALSDAERDDLVLRNVCRLVDRPELRRRKIRPMTVEQVELLLGALPHDAYGDALRVAAGTGARISEVLALTWRNVDLSTGTIAIEASLVKLPGKAPELSYPKTEDSNRDVNLPAFAIAALRDQRERQRRDGGGEGAWADLVFTRPRMARSKSSNVGMPLSRMSAYGIFVRTIEALKLPRAHPHQLRHTAASIAISRGAPLLEVSALLGHASINTTSTFYASLYDQARRDFAARLELQPVEKPIENVARGGPDRGSKLKLVKR